MRITRLTQVTSVLTNGSLRHLHTLQHFHEFVFSRHGNVNQKNISIADTDSRILRWNLWMLPNIGVQGRKSRIATRYIILLKCEERRYTGKMRPHVFHLDKADCTKLRRRNTQRHISHILWNITPAHLCNNNQIARDAIDSRVESKRIHAHIYINSQSSER
jgi:hypothetical protein